MSRSKAIGASIILILVGVITAIIKCEGEGRPWEDVARYWLYVAIAAAIVICLCYAMAMLAND